jgi:hypothetical protein
MPVVALFGLSIIMSFVASGIVAWLFLWPWLRAMPRADALLRLLVPHTFRFVGLSFLAPGVVSTTLSPAFAAPAAYGDLIAGVLAIAALLSLRGRAIWAVPLIWLFNVWGTADLLNAWVRSATVSILARSARPSSSRPCWCLRCSSFMGSFSGYCCGRQHTELASPTWRATITFRAGRARRGPGRRESGRGLRAARAEPAPLFQGRGAVSALRVTVPSVNRTPALKLLFLRAGRTSAPDLPRRRSIAPHLPFAVSGRDRLSWVMGWTPPDGIYVPR